MTAVYVALLDEGTNVWRPVNAVQVGGNVYRLSLDESPDEDETWEFSPGEVVRCEHRMLSDGPALVAVERVVAAT